MIEYDNKTGLVFANTVPFTKESILSLQKLFSDYDDQYELAVIVYDNLNQGTVSVDADVLSKLVSYLPNVASEEDF